MILVRFQNSNLIYNIKIMWYKIKEQYEIEILKMVLIIAKKKKYKILPDKSDKICESFTVKNRKY